MRQVIQGSPVPGGVPQELVEYWFCRWMGWTGNQLDAEPRWRVELWREFWQMEMEERKHDQQ